MHKIYFSYLSASFILPFVVSTVFFVSFLMTFELFRIMTLMASDDISIAFLAKLVLDVMKTLVPMAVPISLFFSTIFCLGKLSGDSEYVALRAAGLNKRKIFTPFLLVSVMSAVSIFFYYQEVVPGAHKSVRKKIKIVSSASLIQGLKSGQFFTNIPNITIFPAEFNENDKSLKEVFIHTHNPKAKEDRIIVAEKGKILHKKDESTGLESLNLFLENGNITTKTAGDNDITKVLFNEYTLPVSQKKFSYRTSLKEIMMDYSELTQFINGGKEAALKNDFSERDYNNAIYEYWNRINTALLCVLLTFVGFGLGVTGNRGKKKNSSGKAILVLIGYYVIYFGLVGVARDGSFPIVLGVFLPLVFLLINGIRFYRKIDWLS